MIKGEIKEGAAKMRMILLIGASALIPSMLTAQQWQSMEGPYFVYNVTGISIGWTDFGQPGQQAAR